MSFLVYDYVDDWLPQGPYDNLGFPFTAFPRWGGVNIWDSLPEGENWFGFHVIYDEPFPVSENTVFCDFLLAVTTADPLGFFAYAGPVIWVEKAEGGDHLFVPHYAQHGTMPPFFYFLASINSEHIPIKTESHTWSEVKALYR